MLYIKVEKKQADEVRRKMIERGIYAKGYRSFSDNNFVFVPVKERPNGKWCIVELSEEKKAKPRNLKELLVSKIGKEAADKVFSSFDIVGDICIIEVPEGLEKHEKEIAESIMLIHKNVKTVAKKTGAVEGEYRVRPLRIIAGKKATTTLYKEHGCRIILDIAKVYFSIRLSHERKRIAALVRPGENILALFAGVGPFPLVIAKNNPDANIVAIELNPEAVKFMRKNITLNKAKNITVEEGDAREIVMDKYRNFADRILMPLPRKADSFLDVAFAGAKDKCVVHIYAFGPIEDPYSDIEKRIAEEAKKAGAKIEILNKKIVRPFAPKVVQVAVDFMIQK